MVVDRISLDNESGHGLGPQFFTNNLIYIICRRETYTYLPHFVHFPSSFSFIILFSSFHLPISQLGRISYVSTTHNPRLRLSKPNIMHNHPIKSYTNQTKLWLLYFYSRYEISIVWLLFLWMDMHDIILRLFSVLKQGAMMSFKSTTSNLFRIYVLEETLFTIFSQRIDNLITLRKIIK